MNILRHALVWAVGLPLALILGLVLASPMQFTSIAVVGVTFGILLIPVLLRCYYGFLVFAWNAPLIVFFVPGQPKLAFVIAFVGFCILLLTRPLRKFHPPGSAKSLSFSLIFMGVVVFLTAVITGGFGISALGGEASGAKRYLGVLGPVCGFFILTSQTIPRNKALPYATMFFASGIAAIFADIAFALGPKAYFLFNVFPPQLAFHQAVNQNALYRLEGVAVSAMSACYVLLLRYGIMGLLNWSKPWRGMFFVACLGSSLLGGFRSAIVVIGLVFGVHCLLERVSKIRLVVSLLVGAVLMALVVVGFADKLPLSVQRSLSFLPLENLDPVAKADAEGTVTWRLQMWKILLPEIPKYLWLGKGYTFNATDYLLVQEARARGIPYEAHEDILISGHYHHGLLTILIPFGIWGLLGFAWFCFSALRVLYQNYRCGSPALASINTFLLSFFIARLIYYLVFYGQFDLDFILFAGILGLSIAVNGGVCRKAMAPETVRCEMQASTTV